MKTELRYKGRNTKQFTYGALYQVNRIFLNPRGSRGETLEIYQLNTCYRITPYEFKHFWEYKDVQTAIKILLKDLYEGFDMRVLVYPQNPLLAMISKDKIR